MRCFSDMFNTLKSEDKTLRINRDEEAEMNNNFEENGLVKENGEKAILVKKISYEVMSQHRKWKFHI